MTAANAQREQAAQSPGFDAGHEVNREWASDISRGASWFRGASELYSNMAGVFRDVNGAHDNIDETAHQQLAAAKTNLDRQAIITANNTEARVTAANGVEMIGAYHTYFKTNYGSDYITLASRLADAPLDGGPPQPVPNDGHGVIVPLNNKRPKTRRGDADQGEESQQDSGQNAALPASPRQTGAARCPCRRTGTHRERWRPSSTSSIRSCSTACERFFSDGLRLCRRLVVGYRVGDCPGPVACRWVA